MKIIYLVRHAKAVEHNAARDFERTLAERGKSDAANIGSVLKGRSVKPDLILSSPAARTMATAIIIAKEIQYPETSIADNRSIYNAELDTLLKVIRGVGDEIESLMLVGHNPGITEFTNALFATMISSMPTCAVTGGKLNVNSWKMVKWGCGNEDFFVSPE